MTKREKLLAKYTFATYYAKCKAYEENFGLLSPSMVMKLQVIWVSEQKECVKCHTTEDLTADHILPAVFLKMLGYPAERMFREEWYQALCWPCNKGKAHRVEWENPRTCELLLAIMEEKPTFEYATLKKLEAKRQQEWKAREKRVFGDK